MSRTLHDLPRFATVFTLSVVVAACGGGGGGGSDKTPPTPVSGNSTATPNASLVSIKDNTYRIAYTTENIIKFGQFWSDPLMTGTGAGAQSRAVAMEADPAEESIPVTARAAITEPVSMGCPLGGKANQQTSGDHSTGSVTRTIHYVDCKDPAAVANGTVTIVSRLGTMNNRPYIPEQIATFTDFNLASEDENLTLNGETRYTSNLTDKTFTLNLSILDNLTGDETRTEDIHITAPFNALLIHHFYRFSLTGKMHFTREGTLDFNKTDRNSSRLDIAGKNGTSLSLEALNTDAGITGATRRITADTDGDGMADRHAMIPWSLYYPKGENTANPVAVISPSEAATTVGSTLELSGAGSTDEDYTPLYFSWQVSDSAPGNATLSPANGVTTRFTADQPGTYEVILTVDDGAGQDSEVVYVTVQ